MLNYNTSQIKFAGKILKQKAAMARPNAMKTVIDLPISSEMINLIDSTIHDNDEEGYLSEKVGSVLAQPLSSLSILCPTAAILQSSTTASRIPGVSKNSTNFAITNGSRGDQHSIASTMSLGGDKPTLQDTKSRLEVMWLQRKAELSKESGNFTEAINILNDAIHEHLGGQDYINAGLSKPIVSSDPEELLNFIDNDFFVYDKLAHAKASKIQKAYKAFYGFKSAMATMLTKVYRGHMHRKVVRRYKEIRRQCAVLLQRRFRIHLVRMNRLATMIKVWYKLRKDVKAYQKRLRIYQMARRIQRLFRGNKGRERYRRKRREMLSRLAIQKNFRGTLVRRDRSFALMLFHRQFVLAAQKIQQMIRRVQAVQRAQIKLLVELTRENIRDKKEQIVVLEAQRMQKIQTHYYVKTVPGQVRLKRLNYQLAAKKLIQTQINETLSEEEAIIQHVIEIVEKYDEDGTGRFDVRRLRSVLRKLAIPANKEFLYYVAHKLDPEDLGYISIQTFLQWYETEEVDDLLEPSTLAGRLERIRLECLLRLKKTIRDALRKPFSRRATEKTLRQEQSAWITRDTINTFRQCHAPKYQCCQCLQAFLMFTDYYIHFGKETGHCLVTDQKALFYPKYWSMEDWHHQRQVEYEVIRVNDEVEYCKNRTSLALYEELAYGRRGSGSRDVEKRLCKQATVVYKEKCAAEGVKSKELKAKSVEMIFEILGIAFVPDPPKPETPSAAALTSNSLDASAAAEASIPENEHSSSAPNSKPTTPAPATARSAASGKGGKGGKGAAAAPPPPSSKSSAKTPPASAGKKGASGKAPAAAAAAKGGKPSSASSAATPRSSQAGGGRPDTASSGRSNGSRNSISSNSSSSGGGLSRIPTVLVECVMDVLWIPMKNKWVADDVCFTLMELRNWLNRYIINRHRDADHASFSDNHKSVLKSDVNSQTNPDENALFNAGLEDKVKFLSRMKVGLPPRSEGGMINARCEELGEIYVRVLRILQVLAYSELFALIEYRTKRPRRSTISEVDLITLDLFSLTRASYELKMSKLVTSLAAVQQHYIKLYSAKIPKYCADTLQFWRRLFRYAPVAGEEDAMLTVPELLQAQLRECHFYVNTEVGCRLRSPLGNLVAQRYAALLKNRKNILLRGNTRSSKMDNQAEAELIYLFNLCCWVRSNFEAGGEVLDSVSDMDADLLLFGGGLKLPKKTGKEKLVLEALDPENTGAIVVDIFRQWMLQESTSKQYGRLLHPLVQTLHWLQDALHLRRLHWYDARRAITVDKRHLTRTEIELHSRLVSDFGECHLSDHITPDQPDIVVYMKDDPTTSFGEVVTGDEWRSAMHPSAEVVTAADEAAAGGGSGVVDGGDTGVEPPPVNIDTPVVEESVAPVVSRQSVRETVGFEDDEPHIAARTGDINSLWIKRQKLKQSQETAEHEAFFDYVEDKAEKRLWLSLLGGGQKDLDKVWMERRLVRSMEGVLRPLSRCSSYSKEWTVGQLQIERLPLSVGLGMESTGGAGAKSSKSGKSSKSFRAPKSIRIKGGAPPVEERRTVDQLSPALGHELYLDSLINMLDVSCSGALDIRVVRCVLQTLRCSVSDRQLFYHFPELTSPDGLISVARLVDYLRDKVTYIPQRSELGLAVMRVSDARLAVNMLVASSRQLAHAGVQQTVSLTSFGHIAVVDRTEAVLAANDGARDYRAVILRSQALALRQVDLFVQTAHGQIKLYYLEKTAVYLWDLHTNPSSPTSSVGREQLLRYCIALHSERDRVLITELPHLIHHLTSRFGVTANPLQMRKIPHLLDKVRTGRDIRWFHAEDLFSLLDPIMDGFAPTGKTNFLLRNSKTDALVHMQSVARQQAVLISMNFQDIVVPETNYRCSILGLHWVMAQLRSWHGGGAKGVKDEDAVKMRKNVNWSVIPRECCTLYLMTAGYLFNDFSDLCLVDLVAIDHSSGSLHTDEVTIDSLKKIAKDGIAKNSTWRKSFVRLGSHLRPIKNWKTYQEYKYAVLAIQQCPGAVNKKGGDYLKELLTGVSHCAMDLN